MAAVSGSNLLACAVNARRAQLMQRVVMACVISLVMSQLIGWDFPIAWLMIYGAAQAVESAAFGPMQNGTRLPFWRAGLGLASVAFNAASFGALAIPLWLSGHEYGGICASLLLAAAVINTVVATPGSVKVLFCAMTPPVAYMLAGAWYLRFLGAPAKFQVAVTLATLVFCGYAIALWRSQEQRRVAEEAAREDAERRRQEAEAATLAKSVYVATIGHELRTPISAMLAGAIELERSAKGSTLRPHAALIADAGRMMKTLLDDVLDHAKLEAGRMSIETVSFDLRAIVAQTTRFWQSEARKKGLRLRVEGSAGLPQWVAGDPTRLRQILNNLISNAVKFTDQGSVTLGLSAWSADEDAFAVRLQVIDTGSGMDPDQLKSLFNAFHQADKSIARNYGGTGLGLVISRELARLMGGQLTAYSRKGEGSTFTLALTFGQADAPAVTESAIDAGLSAPVPGGRPLRVLVADDHEINRRAVQLVLAPMGVELTAVCDGRAAVEAAQTELFDLIVMDVRMPEMDGRAAARAIRASDGPNRHVPIIAVTADTDKVDVQACRDAGMDWFVGKPIDPAVLVKTALQAMEAGHAASAEAVSPGQAEEEQDRPVRVLVADDHEINRRAVQLVLQPAGAAITMVVDGKQAFEAALKEGFDVIVMDVRMPEMDGREATRMIRATPGPNQHTPVIAVTAEADSQACFDAGMNWFVPKPIDPGKLMAAVLEALEAANPGEPDEIEAEPGRQVA